MQVINFIVNQVMREPSIFLGLVVLLGMLFLRKKGQSILVSVIKTIVGVRILQVGAGLLVSSSTPMMNMLVSAFGLQGRVGDNWVLVGEATKTMEGTSMIGQVGMVMILAWLLHLVFSRLTPLKVVYLTGHVAYTDTVSIIYFVWLLTKWDDWRAIVYSVILLAVYWWLFPALMAKPLKKLVGDDNITIGHNMAAMGWLAMVISKFTGDEKQDTEKVQLPGWLNVMKDSVISYSLIMATLYTLIGILSGPVAAKPFIGSYNYIVFSFMQGINIAVGVTILLLGVRMFLAELLPAFQGFAKVVVPGAIPAVDNPVFWTYAPIATLLGLIFTVFGMVVGILMQVAMNFTFIEVPSVIPIFFGGCTLGAFASKYGGVRGTIIATFLLGIVQVFGAIWLSQTMGLTLAAGHHIDYCTFWPAVLNVLKLIPYPL